MTEERGVATPMRVRSDPSLRPIEKETSLGLLGGGTHFAVESRHPSAVKGLLAQPEFTVTELITRRIGSEQCIVGVKGQLPVASVKIGKARRDGRLSRMFSRRRGTQKHSTLRRCDAKSDPPVRQGQ